MICRPSCHLIPKGTLSRFFLRKASNAVLDNLRPLEDFTRRLISASATGHTSYNHRDAAALWSVIPQTNRSTSPPPSLDKAQFLAQNDMLPAPDIDPLDSNLNDTLEPGTFVELRRNRIVTHGIVLQLKVLEAKMHAFTLTFTGEVWPHLTNDITYAIPNFVSQDLLERAGDGYEALSTIQTTARLQIVEQVRAFTRQHERHFNAIAKDIYQLYEKMRHRNPDQWTDITTPDATRFLDVRNPPPVLTLFAMHAHLMGLPLYYVADPQNHRATHRFSIRPLSHVQTILQVDEWVRTGHPNFKSFLQSARKVIQKSREIRENYWDVSPSRFDGRFPPWSPSDLTFIRYLQNALRTGRRTQDDPYDYSLPPIIKAMDMYRDDIVGPGLAQLMLTELGVLTPWDDVITRFPELRLDIVPPGQSKEAQTMDELVKHSLTEPNAPVSPLLKRKLHDCQLEGSTELLTRDPLESQRHDFGDMPVYIVDDDSAEELDDGISIEYIPGEPGNYWVHVHVADPTAVVPSGHILDLQAKKMVTAFYSSHRTWAMLPSTLTKPLFSLGAKSGPNGQEVLTFSVKISDSAEFLDYKVRAGIVHNTHTLTYGQVDSLLGLKHSHLTYPFHTPHSTVHRAPIPEACHSDLRKLHEIADRVYRRTLETNPIINFSFPMATVRFHNPPPTNPLLPALPILWKGYPSTMYVIEDQEEGSHGFRQVIAEWMKLAGRVASCFCRDNDLPALRRASQPLQSASLADTNYLLSMRSPRGYVDALECIKRNVHTIPGRPTLAVEGHWGLGIPDGEGYCRVTSPLRRYGDLIMHWQIKNALLPGHNRPLFSAEYLESIMHQLYEKEKLMMKAAATYNKHCAHTYLARYIQGERRKHGPKYDPFPKLLARTTASTAYDTLNATGQVSVVIPSLGVHGDLKGIDGEALLPIGTTLSVKITGFELGIPSVIRLGLA